MGEQFRYSLVTITAETMHLLMEAEYQQGERELDAMMRRLKDLSAYSLTHAEILEQREGVEMLALARFFGMTSESRLRSNQRRLAFLSEDVIDYQGRAEVVERQIQLRRRYRHGPQQDSDQPPGPVQPRLL